MLIRHFKNIIKVMSNMYFNVMHNKSIGSSSQLYLTSWHPLCSNCAIVIYVELIKYYTAIRFLPDVNILPQQLFEHIVETTYYTAARSTLYTHIHVVVIPYQLVFHICNFKNS